MSSEKESSRPDPIERKPTCIQDRKENVLCAAEGVSIKKAKMLLECYGSNKNIANESIEDLQKAPGIGEKTAINIYNIFN